MIKAWAHQTEKRNIFDIKVNTLSHFLYKLQNKSSYMHYSDSSDHLE